MERRRFFFYLAGAATAATITGAAGAFTACQSGHRPAISRMAHPDFLLQVSDTATIRAIGEAYRNQTPAESRPNQLTALLENHADPQSIRQQYTDGNTITIKGWVLSLTEARQCALFSLESQ